LHFDQTKAAIPALGSPF